MKNAPPPRAKTAPSGQAPRPAVKPGSAKPVPVQAKQQVAAKTKTPVKPPPVKSSFLGSDPNLPDVVNEVSAKAAFKRAAGLIGFQTTIIAVLGAVLVFGQPLFQPIYEYYTLNGPQVTRIVSLTKPNMTNRAVVSWTESIITEIMTIGFGDFSQKLISQKSDFTSDGWDAFVSSFLNQGIDETFRKEQLVLTTIPVAPAKIDSQGPTDDGGYRWKISMPVVMTYATNNNVTSRQKANIRVTVVRDPDSPSGIAIDTWSKD